MELRWYWRVLQRQSRIIVTTLLVVAVLAAVYTAYTFYGGYYKAQTTLEFSQNPPNYKTTNLSTDPLVNALGNAGSARDAAKVYTEGLDYFHAIQAYLLQNYNRKIDWKTIRAGLGANPNAQRFLDLEYKSSNQTTAEEILASAVAVLNADFLPDYNKTVTAAAPGSIVQEFPITTRESDPPSTTTTSLSSTVVGWLEKVIVGVVLGVALAFLWEYMDETIHDEQDIRVWMHTPTLGVLPVGK